MTNLRIIGDVHAQIHRDDVLSRQARPYLELIAGTEYSIQVGDMGDGESYDQLVLHVDAGRHRFFPGNHDHYDRLPPHSLGDFGTVRWGGVDFFFVRGAASADQDKLIRLGRKLNKTLWFEEEELTEEQMRIAEQEYTSSRPEIVLSHDAPTEIAGFVWNHARKVRPANSNAVFRPSRTNAFLSRLREQHSPRIWVFGHYHRDWVYRESGTLFACVGELSFIDINAACDFVNQ